MNGGYHSVTRIIEELHVDEDERGKLTTYMKGERAFPVHRVPSVPITEEFRTKQLEALKKQLLPEQTIAFVLKAKAPHNAIDVAAICRYSDTWVLAQHTECEYKHLSTSFSIEK